MIKEGALSIMNAIDSTIATCSGRGEFLKILGKIKRFNDAELSLMTESNKLSRKTILKKCRTANRTSCLFDPNSDMISVREAWLITEWSIFSLSGELRAGFGLRIS